MRAPAIFIRIDSQAALPGGMRAASPYAARASPARPALAGASPSPMRASALPGRAWRPRRTMLRRPRACRPSCMLLRAPCGPWRGRGLPRWPTRTRTASAAPEVRTRTAPRTACASAPMRPAGRKIACLASPPARQTVPARRRRAQEGTVRRRPLTWQRRARRAPEMRPAASFRGSVGPRRTARKAPARSW